MCHLQFSDSVATTHDPPVTRLPRPSLRLRRSAALPGESWRSCGGRPVRAALDSPSASWLPLPPADFVRRSRSSADTQQRGRGGRRLDLAGYVRLDADQAAGGHGHALVAERRHHLAGVDEVDLLLAGVAFVVLGDQHLARVLRDRVDPEGRDAEVVPDRLPGLRPVRLHRRDVVHLGDLPASALRAHAHVAPPRSGEPILLPAVVHDLEAAVAEALLRVEVGDPELAIVRGHAQLDRLDAAPAALLDGVSQEARSEAASTRRRLHPDLLDLGARAAAGRDPDRRCRDGGLVCDHEEPAARVAQDRLDVLLQVAHYAALVAEERLQERGDRRRVVAVRDPGRRGRHSATPQCLTAAMASAPAHATRSSTGTYSSTVWAHSMLRGPYPIDGVPPKRVKVAA